MTVMSIKMTELQYKRSINHLCNQTVPCILKVKRVKKQQQNVTIIWLGFKVISLTSLFHVKLLPEVKQNCKNRI